MAAFMRYLSYANHLWGEFGGLPAPARWVVTLVALPFLTLISLCLVAMIASFLALLAVTGPVYWALWRLSNALRRGSSRRKRAATRQASSGTKRVESTVIS